MCVLSSEFLGIENIDTTYRHYQLKAFKLSVFNLYQRIFSISLEKENVESNFININGDLN